MDTPIIYILVFHIVFYQSLKKTRNGQVEDLLYYRDEHE